MTAHTYCLTLKMKNMLGEKLKEESRKIFAEFYEALEERQDDFEKWAKNLFETKGCFMADFEITRDKEIKFKRERCVLSIHYYRPLCMMFSGYEVMVYRTEGMISYMVVTTVTEGTLV